MSILPRRVSLRLAAGAVVVVALAAVVAVSLFFALANRGVPAPTDGIGDIPTAQLVPEDVVLYVGLNTDKDSDAWRGTFALLERLGMEEPLGPAREGAEDKNDADWHEAVEPFLGGAAVLFVSSFNPEDDEGPSGAVIFHASDASAAEAAILDRRSDGFGEGDYRGVSYKVMEEGGVLAVMGEHLVYAAGEPTVHAIVDTRLGETSALADSDDFRRLRNELSGDALAFVYVDPAILVDGALPEGVDEEQGPDILALLGLDELVSRPLGMVVSEGDGAFHVRAAALGDPGSIVSLLRPRESRFAELVPADTVVFVSVYDLAGVVEDAVGRGGLVARLQDAAIEAVDEDGQLARLDDLLALLDGEFAFALWLPHDVDSVDEGGFALLAEVADEDEVRELLGEFFAEPIAAGEMVLSVEDGIAAVSTSAAAIETVLDGDGPTLAGSERYTTTVAALDFPLATFAYIDIWRLLASGEGAFDGLDLDGDALGFIVNLGWKNDRVQVDAALTIAPAD